MKNSLPFIRYISHGIGHFYNKWPNMAYDCRMIYVLFGEGELWTESKTYQLQKNTLAYYPSGFCYLPKAYAESNIEFITVNFDFTLRYDRINKVQIPVKPEDFRKEKEMATQNDIEEELFRDVFVIRDALFLRDTMLRLCEVAKKDGVYKNEILGTLLKLCLLNILSFNEGSYEHNDLIDSVCSYIDEHYDKIDSNETIARHFKYHSYYLNDLFKKYTGTTLHQYLCGVRIKNSRRMLLETEIPIFEIALACGFSDADSFSRLFRSRVGTSPTKYRRIMRESKDNVVAEYLI